MHVTSDPFRQAMRRWTSGITIVSASYQGVLHGMTASSFTSLSVDPPRVMVSLAGRTRTHGLVVQAKAFGVSILAQDQDAVSNRFANDQTEMGARFEGLDTFVLRTGAPFVAGGLAFFDCRVVDTLAAGENTLFVGEVVSVQEGENSRPLVYFSQSYRRLVDE